MPGARGTAAVSWTVGSCCIAVGCRGSASFILGRCDIGCRLVPTTRGKRGVDRNERLLLLLAMLRRQRAPLSFAKLRQDLPGAWEGARAAARRKFERDKKSLEDLGVLLRWDAAGDGYVLDRRSLDLRPVHLGPEQAALLRQAAALVAEDPSSPFAPEIHGAFARLAAVGEPTGPATDEPGGLLFHHPSREDDPDLPDRLGRVALAAWRRLPIRFLYRKPHEQEPSPRSLEPWGVFASRGRWFAVGRCPEAGAERTFALGRMGDVQVVGLPDGPPRFDRPRGFDLRAVAARKPWDFAMHDPVEVIVRAEEAIAGNVARVLVAEPCGDDPGVPGTVLLKRTVTWTSALVEALGEWIPRVEVAAPEEVRAAFRAPLDAIAGRHAEVAP